MERIDGKGGKGGEAAQKAGAEQVVKQGVGAAAALDCALKQSHEEPARHVDDEDAQRKGAPDHVHDGDPVPGVRATEEGVCVMMMYLRWLWDESVSPLKRSRRSGGSRGSRPSDTAPG